MPLETSHYFVPEAEFKIETHNYATGDAFALYKKGMAAYSPKRVWHLVKVCDSLDEAKLEITSMIEAANKEKKRREEALLFDKDGKQL
jgi:hypothetical protein